MPVQAGGDLDKKYRRAIEAQGPNTSTALSMEATMYGGPGKVPSYDWPLPRQRPRPLILENLTLLESLVPSTLIGQDRIYAGPGQVPVYTWTVPAGPLPHRENRTLLETLVGSTLVGQDTIYAAPGQAPVYDWPVPKGYVRPLEHRTFSDGHVTNTLIGQDQLYGAPGESPVYDWIVPKGYPRPIEHRRYLLSLVTSFLAGQDSIYAGPGQVPVYTWTVPPGPLPSRENRTFLTSLVDLILAGQDRMYDGPGQVASYDWTVPKGAARFVPFDQPLNALGALSSGIVSLPAGIQLLIDRMFATLPRPTADAFRDLVLSTLVGQDTIYGAPGESPSYDWPLPRGAQPSRENRTYLQSLVDLVLAGQDRLYGGPGQVPSYDLGLPRGAARPLFFDQPGNPQGTLFFLAGALPAGVQLLLDRFLATLPRPTADALRNTVLTTLAGQDSFYGAPGEVPSFTWTVPRGQQRALPFDESLNLLGLLAVAASPIGAQLYLDRFLATLPRPTADALRNLVLTTLAGQDAIYGAPGESPRYDWPNPRGAAPSRENRTYLTSLVDLILAGQGRIYGAPGEVPTYDWRNPKGPSRAQVLDTLNLLAELTFVPPTFPVGEIVYPGPRPYPRPMFLDLVYDFLVGTNRTFTVDPTSALSITGQTGALPATGMTSALSASGQTIGTVTQPTSVSVGPSETKATVP